MKRYAPIFLLSLCLVMVAFVGSLLLSGHADEKTEEFLPELVIYTTLPAETVQSLLTEEAQKQGLKLQVRSFTASADLLKQLQEMNEPVSAALNSENAQAQTIELLNQTEASFRLMLNNDPMANEKLAEGIRLFCVDTEKLVTLIEQV